MLALFGIIWFREHFFFYILSQKAMLALFWIFEPAKPPHTHTHTHVVESWNTNKVTWQSAWNEAGIERANRDLLHAFHEYRVLSKLPVYRSEYKLRFYILSTCQLIPPTTSTHTPIFLTCMQSRNSCPKRSSPRTAGKGMCTHVSNQP